MLVESDFAAQVRRNDRALRRSKGSASRNESSFLQDQARATHHSRTFGF
jgi:hypothetical protein